jgi:hypothetical protein
VAGENALILPAAGRLHYSEHYRSLKAKICVIRVICGLSTLYALSDPFTISRSIVQPDPAPLVCVYLRPVAP